MKQANNIAKLLGAWLVFAGTAFAQAPPGPIAPVPSQRSSSEPPPPPPVKIVPRTNILGAWKLNRDESDDPKARSNQRKVNDPNQGHGGNSGPRIGFPGGGMGGPGMGGGQRGNGGRASAAGADRAGGFAEVVVRAAASAAGEDCSAHEYFGGVETESR